MEHDVGVLDTGPAPGEAARLQVAGGGGTRLIEEPLDPDGNHAGPLLVLEEGDGLLALLDHVELQVVLQVLTDPGNVLHQGNPHLFQVVSVTDS